MNAMSSAFGGWWFFTFDKKTFMSNEHIESLQSSMQFLPTRVPKIVLQRVEEEFPIWREIIVSATCLCADKRIVILF
jgi:hypothetical protein